MGKKWIKWRPPRMGDVCCLLLQGIADFYHQRRKKYLCNSLLVSLEALGRHVINIWACLHRSCPQRLTLNATNADERQSEMGETLTFGDKFIHLIWLFNPVSGISLDRSGTNEGLKIYQGVNPLQRVGGAAHFSHTSRYWWSPRRCSSQAVAPR